MGYSIPGTKALTEEEVRTRRNERVAIYRQKEHRAKRDVYDLLGGKCARCDFPDRRALFIHHINGTNDEKRSRHRYWRDILTRVQAALGVGAKSHVQPLCANCHTIEHHKPRPAPQSQSP